MKNTQVFNTLKGLTQITEQTQMIEEIFLEGEFLLTTHL